jgi:hypothetical protein
LKKGDFFEENLMIKCLTKFTDEDLKDDTNFNWCHDIWKNDTRQNDNQQNDTQQSDNQENNIRQIVTISTQRCSAL